MRIQAISSVTLFSAVLLVAASAFAVETAKLESGEHVIRKGEVAEFKIASNPAVSTELHASCKISAGGSASLTFDGEHYVPLSEPTVGDVVTLSAGETRQYDLAGTVEANKGDAYIAFIFTDVPAAVCFPGMQCNGAAAGAQEVRVSCSSD